MSDTFKLPGFQSTFNFNNPIIPNGHLTWGEFLHYNPKTGNYRPLPNKQLVENALRLAKAFEEVRARLGNKPLIVSSGYRDPATNAKTPGAAPNSYHTKAMAIDFTHVIMSPKQVQDKMNKWWPYGLELGRSWTHFDIRPYHSRFYF